MRFVHATFLISSIVFASTSAGLLSWFLLFGGTVWSQWRSIFKCMLLMPSGDVMIHNDADRSTYIGGPMWADVGTGLLWAVWLVSLIVAGSTGLVLLQH